jgi:hypothetical protein
LLFQEIWVNANKRVRFEAGYETLSTLFDGKLWTCYSYREGSDIITHVEAKADTFDVPRVTVYETLEANLTVGDVIRNLAGRFGDLKIGAIGNFPERLLRPCVLNGNCWNLLKEYSDNTAFIDNGSIYVLKRNEFIDGDYIRIDPQAGLLSAPKREPGFLQVQMLFEPKFVIGQLAGLYATSQTVYNGDYKVFGIQHIGTISGAVGGDCRTVIDLLTASDVFYTEVSRNE